MILKVIWHHKSKIILSPEKYVRYQIYGRQTRLWYDNKHYLTKFWLELWNRWKKVWTQLTCHLNRHLNLPYLTPQSTIFDFLAISNKDCLIVNHLLLLFKYYIYNARDQTHLAFEASMKNIKNVYDIEKNLADQDPYKKQNSVKNGNLLSVL